MTQPEFKIDTRKATDICLQIKELAAAYTPEWVFDADNPDMGSVLSLIFANQMAGTITRLNSVIEKYHVEFVNMLHLGLLPAYPACGVVAMNLTSDTISGVDVPKGTKFWGETPSEENRKVLFETLTDVHITSAKIKDIVAISSELGKIIPFRGEWGTKSLFPIPFIASSNSEEISSEDVPFGLFDFSQKGIAKNGIAFYHKSVFDTEKDSCISLLIKQEDSTQIAKRIVNPQEYEWSYYGKDGLTPFAQVREEQGVIKLFKLGKCAKLRVEGEEYSAIYLEAKKGVKEEISVSEVGISSACEAVPPTFVLHNTEDLPLPRFMPFGEAAAVFDECYLGSNSVFSQGGAQVNITFQLSYGEKLWSFSQEQEEKELKVIKRKPKPTLSQTAKSCVQRIVFEYFNGIGYKRLPLLTDCSTLFDGELVGDANVSFLCPEDWQPTFLGGYRERAVRIRVMQADNCYLQPCIHTMPIIENMAFSYSYSGGWKMPQKIRIIRGTKIQDVTQALLNAQPLALFSPLPYQQNALYFGFDKQIAGTPLCILFSILEGAPSSKVTVHFEYGSPKGFQRLQLIDHTENMTSSGTIVFVPPADFVMTELEGVSRYWIRLVDTFQYYDMSNQQHSTILQIIPNVADIQNINTLEEEEFYIDIARPYLSFPLAAENILEAEVFVNEIKHFSHGEQKKFLSEHPEDVQVSMNFLGEINEFFVRWQEVPNFQNSKPSHRHYVIDRMENTIGFGDGVSVRIPSPSNDAAFRVKTKCCDGEGGNLPVGMVNTAIDPLLYIDHITSPIATYGGSNMEGIESALRRGENMINSKNRFVSALDITREVMSFSTAILKAKCVRGRVVGAGFSDFPVAIALMMKDYDNGSYSFINVKDRLKERLLERGEALLLPKNLLIMEPIYVEISINVWMEPLDYKAAFEIQNTIKDTISKFIDPAKGKNGRGWEIGTLPTTLQLTMLLKHLSLDFILHFIVVTAKYIDSKGLHEQELAAMESSENHTFMIGVNGVHTVKNFILPK